MSDRRKGEAEEGPVEKLCHLSCCDSSGLTAHKSPSISQLCDMPSSLPLFLFLSRTLILGRQKRRPIVPQTLRVWFQEFGSAHRVCSLRVWTTAKTHMPMSALKLSVPKPIEGSLFFFTVKPPWCCVLPQITSDVTSLSTVYMCEIQRWPNGAY